MKRTMDLIRKIRDVYIDEREMRGELSCDIPRNIIQSYEEELRALSIEYKNAAAEGCGEGTDDVMAREESLRFAFEDLMLLRAEKIIDKAFLSAKEGKPVAITGATNLENFHYQQIYRTMSDFLKAAKVKE